MNILPMSVISKVKHIDIITCKDQYENVQIIDMCNQYLFFAHKTI